MRLAEPSSAVDVSNAMAKAVESFYRGHFYWGISKLYQMCIVLGCSLVGDHPLLGRRHQMVPDNVGYNPNSCVG